MIDTVLIACTSTACAVLTTGIVMYLIKTIQELRERITRLEAHIENIRTDLHVIMRTVMRDPTDDREKES